MDRSYLYPPDTISELIDKVCVCKSTMMYYSLICGETFYFLDRGYLPSQTLKEMKSQGHVRRDTRFTSTSYNWYLVDPRDIIDINSWWCMAEIIGFGPSQPNMYGRVPHHKTIRFFKDNFPRPLLRHVVLYHGTSLTNAQSIMRNGFELPQCKQKEDCKKGKCQCGMMGQCVYFAMYDKATKFAGEDAFWKKRMDGDKAVLRVLVNLGKWTTATPKKCTCCDKPYVDHQGTWYRDYHYDTIYLKENSLPAVRRPEWAVRSRKTKPLSFIRL